MRLYSSQIVYYVDCGALLVFEIMAKFPSPHYFTDLENKSWVFPLTCSIWDISHAYVTSTPVSSNAFQVVLEIPEATHLLDYKLRNMNVVCIFV